MVDRFELRAVYGSVAALADQVAREFQAEREDSFRRLIQRSDIDAILMLESDWYGLLPIEAACEFGKAVFCGSSVHLDPDEGAGEIDEGDPFFATNLHGSGWPKGDGFLPSGGHVGPATDLSQDRIEFLLWIAKTKAQDLIVRSLQVIRRRMPDRLDPGGFATYQVAAPIEQFHQLVLAA